MEIMYLGNRGWWLKGKNEGVLVDVDDLEKIKKRSRIAVYTEGSFSGDDLKNQSDRVTIRGAGEYEVGGVTVLGLSGGPDRTVYKVEIDGVMIGILGDFKEPLNDNKIEKIDGVDVLLVSVEAEMKLVMSWAKKWGVNYLVPAGHDQNKEALKIFLDEVDREDLAPVASLKVEKAELPEGTEVVILEKSEIK